MREKLLEKIELLRQQMIKIGLEYGLDHPDVLSCSQEIDQLHNKLLELDYNQQMNGGKKYCRFLLYENQTSFA